MRHLFVVRDKGDVPPSFGVDRLSLSFRIRRHAERGEWAAHEVRNPETPSERSSFSAGVKVGGADAFVGACTVAGRLWGKVECNPARIADPDGCTLLDPAGVPAAIGAMWEAAADLVEPACSPDDALVKRLDVARDFRGIGRPSFFVQGLAAIHRRYARRTGIWSDAAKGSAQTLHAGSNAGMVRLYDQHEAYAAKGAPPGSLRWEVEAHARWLRRIAGIHHAADLTAERMAHLAAEQWGWSRMGHEVSALLAAVARVCEDGDLSERERNAVLGYLVRRACGYSRTEAAHSNSVRKYERIADRLQVSISPADLTRLGGYSARLDWETGTQVRVA